MPNHAPVILILGAPLPPPYGGIARYLQRSLPEVAAAGFELRIVQPPGCGNELALAPDAQKVTLTELPENRLAALAAFIVRRPRSATTLLRWYLPALIRKPAMAFSDLVSTIGWMKAGEDLLDGRSPRIVHAYDSPWRQGAAAVLLAQSHGATSLLSTFGEVVPHVNELEQHDDLSETFKRTSTAVLAHADQLASMTEHCRQEVGWLGIDIARVRLVRLVVGMEPFESAGDGARIREKHQLGSDPTLLFVGQLRARKGPQTLIRALTEIAERIPDVRALIVGPDHGYQAELESMAAATGVEDRITFTGPVSDEDLPAYYAASDIFVFPTLTPIECLGLTFVQAMFAGKPVIATRIAGAPEVVRDGTDGYLVEPAQVDDLASAAIRMLELEPADRRALGERGRERAQELFNEEVVLNDILDLYSELSVRQ